ncbi:MAG: preprotein translocase subunit SecE [Bacteroidia bacterium]|nr:preprotein translocase subunit SecE [Bacteroidia bacterium]
MKKLVDFVKDSFNELRYKVTWPKYNELQSSSILVLIASLIFALLIGAIDFGFENILGWFYDSF